jgi:hypothetical protein
MWVSAALRAAETHLLRMVQDLSHSSGLSHLCPTRSLDQSPAIATVRLIAQPVAAPAQSAHPGLGSTLEEHRTSATTVHRFLNMRLAKPQTLIQFRPAKIANFE